MPNVSDPLDHRRLGTPSPFVIGTMIREPKNFYGRHAECNHICDRLLKLESTSIVGPRRIGKSSIAYHVFTTAAVRFDALYDFVWVDGQSGRTATLATFCSAICHDLKLAFQPCGTSADYLVNLETAIQSHKKHVALFINEFEAFTSLERRGQFGLEFYNSLRYLAEQGRCALITTSYTSLRSVCREVLEVSSPFYNIFEQISLGDFQDSEAEEFLQSSHGNFALSEQEISFIKTAIKRYRHPLVIQIAADSTLLNRDLQQPWKDLVEQIDKRVSNYLTHQEVRQGRFMRGTLNGKPTLSKTLDITMSVLIPVFGLGALMLEYGLLMQWLSNFKSILLAIVTALIGFAILLFAGRSIDIIGESTFFKLFASLIMKLPVLSTLANMPGHNSQSASTEYE